ncbi:hypothetical protein ACIBI8_37520 [Streptomyces sp. NPDC050529]|uniref:hypothetical protein n=1 Tax=Streptomyces sp. NPDC050529 TaxID=3365624 RepID=UPI0037B9F2E6
MSTNLDPREVEAAASPIGDTQPTAESPPDDSTPPARPHEPGARPMPLSRLLHP